MTQRLSALGIAMAIALGIAIGAGAILVTRPQVGNSSMGSMHAQMMSAPGAAMMSGATMDGVHADPQSGHGTESDEHHQASSKALD